MPAGTSMQITINDEVREIDSETTVAQLLASLGMRPEHVAVEVNLDLVPRAQHASQTLQDGDVLEVVTLVGGG